MIRLKILLFVLKTGFVGLFFGLVSAAYAHDESDNYLIIAALEETELPAFQGDCEKDYVEVLYDDSVDYEMACEGIQRAENFVEKYLSYKMEKPIKILFGDSTVRYQSDGEVKKSLNKGVYDQRVEVIVVHSWEFQKLNNYFYEFPATKDFAISTIVHEVIHRIHHTHLQELELKGKIPAGQFDNDGPVEALSYIAQIEMMDEKEQVQVLSLQVSPWKWSTSVNFYAMINSKHEFAVRSYRYWKEHPDVFLVQLFNGSGVIYASRGKGKHHL